MRIETSAGQIVPEAQLKTYQVGGAVAVALALLAVGLGAGLRNWKVGLAFGAAAFVAGAGTALIQRRKVLAENPAIEQETLLDLEEPEDLGDHKKSLAEYQAEFESKRTQFLRSGGRIAERKSDTKTLAGGAAGFSAAAARLKAQVQASGAD
jgi:hypothetical protein